MKYLRENKIYEPTMGQGKKVKPMTKRATIVISLLEESEEAPNEEIEKEIREELKDLPISWCREVEKVTVTEKP